MKNFQLGNPLLLRKLCTEMATVLQQKYPHVAWGVKPSEDGSVIYIQPFGDAGFDGSFGWTVHTTDIQPETGRRKKLIHIGGEILERYNIARAAVEILESNRPRNTRGELQPELH